MGEYEPNDSRDVTQSTNTAPGEPQRTGPREDEARRRAQAEQQDERRHEKSAGLEGDQPQGAHETGGEARPGHDQYEVNQAGSINKSGPGDENEPSGADSTGTSAAAGGPASNTGAQQQGGGSQSQSMGSMTQSQGQAQSGYGNSRDEKGRTEQDEANGGTPGANPAETARIDAARPLGKD